MPLLRFLEFAARDLHVSYCASREPQDLFIDVKTAGVAFQSEVQGRLSAIVGTINAGGGGGDTFHPAECSASVVSSPDAEPGSLGPDYHFHLQVAGVAPRYLRHVVEELRFIGFNQPVVYMSIAGSRPLDGSPLSVVGSDVRGWLDDPDAYLPEWPSPEFDVSEWRAYGASIHLQMVDPFTIETERAIRQAVYAWIVGTQQMVDGQGREITRIMHLTLPRDGASKSGYRAMCEEFLHRPKAARALLVNILARSHAAAPIRSMEIGI